MSGSGTGAPGGAHTAAPGTQRPRRHASIKARVDCSECGQPVPLDGPVRQAHCNMCQSEVAVRPGLWQGVLLQAEQRHETLLGGAVHGDKARHQGQEMTYELRVAVPACEECGAPFPAEVVSRVETLQFCCTTCGDPASTHPTPDWLRQRVPSAVQVVRTDVVAPEGGEGAVAVRPAEEAPKPVVMACPQCAGSLSVGVESERLYACQFCGAEVYLPDAVWRRLHPVKKVREFFVGFAGPTPREQQQQEQARREAAKRDKTAREQERKARAAAMTSQQRAEARERLVAGHAAARPMVLIAWLATLVYAGLALLHVSMPAARLPASVAGPNTWRMLLVASLVAGLCLAVSFVKPVRLLHEHGYFLGVKGVLALVVPLVMPLTAWHASRGGADFEDLHPPMDGVPPASRPFGLVMAALTLFLAVAIVWTVRALVGAGVVQL
jgi:hypothetical protein